MKRCPKCGGARFDVTAHVAQDWMVDENGHFMRELDSCIAVLHDPDDDDIWTCHECGYEDTGGAFNVVNPIAKEEMCPMCGHELKTFTPDEDGYGVMFIPWICHRCNISGKSRFEHSGWHFVGHELDIEEEK